MALKGNLRDFTITQLLNLINLARKTGTLIIEGPNDTAWVSFKEGKLAYAKMGKDDNRLATILYRAKKISPSQYKMIRARAGNMSDKELGLLLINANYITQEDILTSLQAEYIGVVHRLFTWVEGLFRFENGVLPPDDKITLRINLENIIIEGTRRLREWEQLQDEIPSLEIALKFTDRPGTNLRNVNLSVEEWRVVSYINPKNSIRQIANTTKMNDLEIRRIVYGLLQAGLVEMVRVEGAPIPKRGKIAGVATTDPEEQKSLVNRLINRIRSI
jgi:DNA-binding MarR family transcriptional regulator